MLRAKLPVFDYLGQKCARKRGTPLKSRRSYKPTIVRSIEIHIVIISNHLVVEVNASIWIVSCWNCHLHLLKYKFAENDDLFVLPSITY